MHGARRRADGAWDDTDGLFGDEVLPVAEEDDDDADLCGDRWRLEDARAAGYDVRPHDPAAVARSITIMRDAASKRRRAPGVGQPLSSAPPSIKADAYAPPTAGMYDALSESDRWHLRRVPEYVDFERAIVLAERHSASSTTYNADSDMRVYDTLAAAARDAGWAEAAVGLAIPPSVLTVPGMSANLFVSRSLERPWGMYVVTGATGGVLYRAYTRRQ